MSASSPATTPSLSGGELFGTYGKSVIGLVVAFGGSYAQALPDGITPVEWIGVIITTLVATGAIWLVPKTPRVIATYGKAVVGALVTGLGVLVTGWSDNVLTQQDIVQAIVSLVVALGAVSAISNAASSDPVNPDTGKIVPIPADVKDALAIPGDTTVTTLADGGVVLAYDPDKGAADVSEPNVTPLDDRKGGLD